MHTPEESVKHITYARKRYYLSVLYLFTAFCLLIAGLVSTAYFLSTQVSTWDFWPSLLFWLGVLSAFALLMFPPQVRRWRMASRGGTQVPLPPMGPEEIEAALATPGTEDGDDAPQGYAVQVAESEHLTAVVVVEPGTEAEEPGTEAEEPADDPVTGEVEEAAAVPAVVEEGAEAIAEVTTEGEPVADIDLDDEIARLLGEGGSSK